MDNIQHYPNSLRNDRENVYNEENCSGESTKALPLQPYVCYIAREDRGEARV